MTLNPGSTTLVCLDMAGTVVRDDGVVVAAFVDALTAAGLEPGGDSWPAAMTVVEDTMGQSKVDVFHAILGDAEAARRANNVFEESYLVSIESGLVEALPGAEETIEELRQAGIRVCLTTGFSPATRDAVLDALGWRGLVDDALSPADVGRGRPRPDMVFAAALRLGVERIAEVAVVGDSPSDIDCGLRAGAGQVVGVLTGAGTEESLIAAGAQLIVPDVTRVAQLLEAATLVAG